MGRRMAAAALMLAAAVLAGAQARQMSVTVKEAQARASASFLSPVVGTLAYGDRVDVLAEQGPWVRVALPSGGAGWLHSSALDRKRIVLQAGGSVQQPASSGDVALAGKGFNKEIEDRYRKETDLDYSGVDRMEQFTVTPEQIAAFVRSGGLEGGGQ
jgi:uncharacterized protein YraI